MREHDLRSADGTRIQAWRAGDGGPAVLLCPGLGTMPEAWPVLLRPNPGVEVHSWYHRGTFESARPADERRITVDDHVADALAVLDHIGHDDVVVMGWSAGVLVAAELAIRFPHRVSGLLLVAGPPGDPFGGMLGSFGVPEPARRMVATTTVRLIRTAGPLLNVIVHAMPVNTVTATIVRHSGVMLPASPTEDVIRAARRFRGHDWSWYAQLALALADEPARDLSTIRCPITVLAGQYDMLADSKHTLRQLGPLPQARIRLLPTSHFLPLEAPDELAAELMLLIDRAVAVRQAVKMAQPEAVRAI